MLTIHADSKGRALAVKGAWIADAGSLEELVAAHPGARVRTWPGILTPGLINLHGNELLEEAYHPDPREADLLGTAPLTGDALAALDMDDARWGASARRGVQRMLAHGTVRAACEELGNRAVRDAMHRSGLAVLGGSGAPVGHPRSTRTPPDCRWSSHPRGSGTPQPGSPCSTYGTRPSSRSAAQARAWRRWSRGASFTDAGRPVPSGARGRDIVRLRRVGATHHDGPHSAHNGTPELYSENASANAPELCSTPLQLVRASSFAASPSEHC